MISVRVYIAIISKYSDFIWDFGKLPFPTHLGKYFIKIGKIRAKIHEIGKIKAIFGLGMTPINGLKNGQIKSLKYATKIVGTQNRQVACVHGRQDQKQLTLSKFKPAQ